jgi:branched-chain amino acid transport system substrate-binding protein
MTTRRFFVLSLCGTLFLLLASPGAHATGQPEVEQRIIRVGTVLPLSGELEQFGELIRRGYEMWVTQVEADGGIEQGGQRYDVELVIRDDASDPTLTAPLTERLIIEEGVTALLGPFGAGQTLAMAQVAEEYEVPIIAPSAGIELIADRHGAEIYGVLPPARKAFGSFLDLIFRQERGTAGSRLAAPPRLAILARDGVFTEEVGDGAVGQAEDLELEVVFEDRYANERGLTSTVRRALREDPSVVILAGSFEDSVTLMEILRDRGSRQNRPGAGEITLGLLAGPDTFEFARRLEREATEATLSGVFGIAWWTPLSAYEGAAFGSAVDFSRSYVERYGEAPTYHTAAAAQAGLILQRAFESAGGSDLLSLTESLRRLRLTTFWGTTRFDSRGLNGAGSTVTVQIQQGRVLAVWPPEAAAAPPVW